MKIEDIFDGPSGSTRLDEEEKEQLNILAATVWLDGSRMKVKELLTTKRIQLIHRKMFDRVWKWAGKFRRSNKNIGILWSYIPVSLDSLLHDTQTQIEDRGPERWSNDEIAVRFHHRLVAIHPFVNGNGRHARQLYIQALRAADRHDYAALLAFARS